MGLIGAPYIDGRLPTAARANSPRGGLAPLRRRLPDQRTAAFRPGDHTAGKMGNVPVAELDQRLCGDLTHAPVSAIEDDLRVLAGGELVEILGNPVEGDECVGAFNLVGVGNVDVDEKEVLAGEQRGELGTRQRRKPLWFRLRGDGRADRQANAGRPAD